MSRLKFSQEIPVNYVQDLHPYDDQGFVIAPYLLKYPRYAELYRKYYVEKGKRVLVDNGAYELGHSVSVDDLYDALELLDASAEDVWILLPDVPCQMQASLDATLHARDLFHGSGFNLAAVVQGATVKEQWESYVKLHNEGFELLALSFLWNRPQFLKEKGDWLDRDISTHLLGCYEPKEIMWLRQQNWDINFSIDTVKPLKAAMLGKHVKDYSRGDLDKKWDPTVIIEDDQLKQYLTNAEWMQNICNRMSMDIQDLKDYTRPLKHASDSRAI